MQRKFTFSQGDLEVEVGKFARQADGSTWIKAGNNIVLSTAVVSKDEKDFIGFFPLTVEFREKMAASGRIPGGFFKREGKLSDKEVLTSRFIDRSIRPLFPKYYFNEVQLLTTVYSADGLFPLDILSIIGSSLALCISGLPFNGPIGAIKIAKIDKEFIFNPTYDQVCISKTHLLIVGTYDGIVMVEGNCEELSEKELIDLMFSAHEKIKAQVLWQQDIVKELTVQQQNLPSNFLWTEWEKKVEDALPVDFIKTLFTLAKKEREIFLSDQKKNLLQHFDADIQTGVISQSIIKFLLFTLLKDKVPAAMIAQKKRLDGRKFDQVRPLFMQVGLLPCAHGSALFQRGQTQALASLTLGTTQDAQKYDTLLDGLKERFFMLHYNFPPFSTGEIRPIRGVGRREVGHGYLAETSFKQVLPSTEAFPYTIRSVSDILESNGSSSMATVCATTLALMDAGVPIKDMVAGIAMGLIQDSEGNIQTLTDILGAEDAYGLMDFKVTGTCNGIMAIQMDIKAEAGLSKDILINALEQAKKGRLHILEEMRKILDKPRKTISARAPCVEVFNINSDKIGSVIGPAGKIIKEIIEQTSVQVDIEDNGTVKVYSKEAADSKRAVMWIKTLAGNIQEGMMYEGTIRRFADFGVFVELVPGKDGLLHISMISRDRQQKLEVDYKIGYKLMVKVLSYEKETGRVRLMAPELKKPLSGQHDEHKNN